MRHVLGKKWFIVLEAAITVLLFLVCAYAGRQHLDFLNHGRSAVTSIEMLYGPAVMLASGRGFYQPNLNASPVLREFLRNERETLSPGDLPGLLPEEPNSVSAYHRYLLYTVALFWRILGISWTSLELLCAMLLGVCAVAVYGILRLGMGRLLSAALTLFFVLSPQMLTMLPSLRDFSKAPFILLLIFLLGVLIKYRFGMKALAGISVLLGLVNGIAMGFRQDALVFILPACIIVTVSVFRYERPFLRRRLLAPVLLLAAFFAAGHPMLGRMEGGAQPYHPLVQGFSMKRFASLGLEPGAYEPLASGSDNYTFAMLQDYYGRVNAGADTDFRFNSPGAEAAGRQFLLDMALRFPGDLLARGYGALLRTLRYTDGVPLWHITGSPWQDRFEAYHEALKHHLHRYGPAYAVPALLLISGHSLPLAFGLLFFVLYTCGYVSLQCEFRHAFHLSFVPLWILGFLLHCLVVGVLGLRKGFSRERVAWRVPVQRAVLFAVAAAAMMLLPLYGLRFYQRHRVMPVLETILAAERRPVALHRHAEIEWERFALEVPEAPAPAAAAPFVPDTDVEALCAILAAILRATYMEDGYPAWHTQTRYFVLEFAPDADPGWLMLLYASAVPMNNFSQLIRMHLPETTAGSVFYFFPVYELKMPLDGGPVRNRFLGVALPKAHAEGFRGLYEVPDIAHLRFLPHAALPLPEGLLAGTYYGISLRPDPLDAFRADDESIATLDMADAAVRFGREQDAVLLYAAALLVNKHPMQRLYIAQALMELGNYDAASKVILEALEDPAGEKAFAASLLGTLAGRLVECGAVEALERTLSALRALWLEKDPGLLLNVLDVVAEKGYGTVFLEQCRPILLAHPESQAAADFVEARVPGENVAAALAGFWRQVAEARPASVQPFLRLGLANETLGDMPAARQAYAVAYANDPSNPEAARRHEAAAAHGLTAQDAGSPPGGAGGILLSAPDTSALDLGIACEAKGAWQEALEAYQAVTEPDPLRHEADLRRGGVLVRLGDADRGVALIEAAVAADPHLKALGAMLCLQGGADLLLSGQVEPARKSMLLAAAYAPDDPFISLQLGDIHNAGNNTQEAVAAWRRALAQDVAGIAGAEAARRLDAALPVQERLELWEALGAQHPEAPLPRARYALALAVAGEGDAALDRCRALVDAAPDNGEVQVACALVACYAGQVEAGLAQLQRALDGLPQPTGPIVTALADLGLQRLASGRPEEAEPLLRKAIELGPDNLLYYNHLGRALLARGKYEDAAAQFRKVLLEVPESPNAARWLDEAWAGLKDPEKQRQDWSAIVAAHPDAAVPREHLERCR